MRKLIVMANALLRDQWNFFANDPGRITSITEKCDEIWSFCYAKDKNVETEKAAPEGEGDVWTWTAIDAAAPAPKKRGPNWNKDNSN